VVGVRSRTTPKIPIIRHAAAAPQLSGNVLDRHVLVVVEDDDLPVFDGKLSQRFRYEYSSGVRITVKIDKLLKRFGLPCAQLRYGR